MKIEVLFPEICNLFGDLYNANYLAQSCGAEILRTPLKSKPHFVSEKPDLIYMGSMSERSQELAVTALNAHKDRLIELIASGANILVTGNAMELFAKRIDSDDGSSFEALGIFDFIAKREMMNRYNALYVGTFGDMDVVGFKSQFSHAYGLKDIPPLFETVRGDGRNRSEKPEGIHVNNFMATYVLGPLILLTPPFAKYLLSLIGAEEPALAFEDAALEAYHHRVKEFKDPSTGIYY